MEQAPANRQTLPLAHDAAAAAPAHARGERAPANRRALPGVARQAVLATLLWNAAVGRGAEGLVPLTTPLPRPAFTGTPAFLVSPNLEKVTGKLREPFLVPAGTVNLAAGRPVIGSQNPPVLGSYACVTDGNKEADARSFVELSPGLQWVQIDLGEPCTIHAILVWHYHCEARVYRDVVVQLADDPDFISGVRTVFNNDHDNSAGLGTGIDKEYIETFGGRLIPVPGLRARFVRLYSRGSTADDMNHLVEVEVHGVRAP